MSTEHIMSLACIMEELPEMIEKYHKEYGIVPGTEISIRYGTDHTYVNPAKVCVRVFVSRTIEKSLYRGAHSKHYNQELIPAEQE